MSEFNPCDWCRTVECVEIDWCPYGKYIDKHTGAILEAWPLKLARGLAQMQLYMCGKCGAFITGYLDATDKFPPRYCANCGAYLKEGLSQ